MSGESKTSARRIESKEKQRKALELRLAGATLDEIARVLGFADPSGADKSIRRAMKDTIQEPADAVRQLELGRMDKALKNIWPHVLTGNFGAVDRLIKIQERRARLLGLDAPARSELSGPNGAPLQTEDVGPKLDLSKLTDEEFEEYSRLIEKMSAG